MTYRSCFRALLLCAGADTALLTAGGLSGHALLSGAVAVLVTLAWLVTAVRFLRLEPSGPGGYPPGGAGVREPRRPKPRPPADAIALPTPDEPPDDAVAWA
jgi:hypothetical protein